MLSKCILANKHLGYVDTGADMHTVASINSRTTVPNNRRYRHTKHFFIH